MAIYSAYLPPDATGEKALSGFELVPEGKAFFALLFPLIWLAFKRLWMFLSIYAVLSVALVLLATWQPGMPVMYLAALPGLYLLLEGNELVRRKKERSGWQFAGVVDADNRQDAEMKFICANTHLFKQSPASQMRGEKHDAIAYRSNHLHSTPTGLFPE